MKSFSIVGATVSGNRGAEAMLCTTIGQIKDRVPDATFNCFSYYPAKDKALISDPSVHVYSLTPAYLVAVLFPLSLILAGLKKLKLGALEVLFPQSVRALNQSTAVIDLAGVSFIDGREKFLPFNVLTLLPAMFLGTPVVKLAQALGPFRNRINLLCSRLILPRCNKIFARGNRTYQHLKDLGLESDVVQRAEDVAFMYNSRYSLSQENEPYAASFLRNLDQVKGKGIVGVCASAVMVVSAAKKNQDHIAKIVGIVRGLLTEGYHVVLFPNATRELSPELRNNDIEVIRRIMERCGSQEDGRLLGITKDINTRNIQEIIKRCDMVVISRFHAMISALSLGVPLIVVGWSHKYLEVMETFGQGRFVLDDSFKEQDILNLIRDVLSRRDQISREIQQHAPAARESCMKQFAAVESLL